MKVESGHWRLLLLLVFFFLALRLPIITFDYGPSQYYPPPPGWSQYFTYYLASDYDYFWRYRILSITAPFWLVTGIIALLICTPSIANWRMELGASIAISAYTIAAWMVFLQYCFIQSRYFLDVYASPLIPVVGLVFVAVSRFVNHVYIRRQP